MVSRIQVVKACIVSALAALAALALFMVIHTWVVRAADPRLAGTTTAAAAFIAGFATYLTIVGRRGDA
jgi:hypothetical protein